VAPRTPTRDRILDAAERIHSRRGLSELTLRRVAKAVGVTPMAIYKHFEDKSALLDGLAKRGFSILETYFEEAVRKRTPMARVRAALTQLREFALEHPRYFELMYFAQRGAVPQAPASLRETSSPSFARLIADVHAGMQSGDLRRGDPGETILLVWATAHGMIALHFSGRFGGNASMFRPVYDRVVAAQLTMLRS
jgi:AcrR family transcriptional regulator